MTFIYATKVLKLNLQYNENPGGFWGPAEQGLYNIMQTKPDLKIDEVDEFVEKYLPKMTYRTARAGTGAKKDKVKSRHDTKDEETGYDSPSGSEASDMELDIDDL
jgi:hypothetical protein